MCILHPSRKTMHAGWIIHLWLFTLSLKAEAILLLTNGSRERGAKFQSVWITPGPNSPLEQIFAGYTFTGSSSQQHEHKCQCSDSYRTLLSALICHPQARVSWRKQLAFPVQRPSCVLSHCLEFTWGVRVMEQKCKERGKSHQNIT